MSPTAARGERFSAIDSAWYRLEQEHNAVDIGVLLELEGAVSIEALRAVVRDRFAPFARFGQRVVEHRLRGPVWEDDPGFAVERHVAPLELRGRPLAEVVGERLSGALPFDRPLWRIDVVPDAPTGTALIARLHHCIADGFALARMMLAIADEPLGEGGGPARAPIRLGLRDLGPSAAALGHLLAVPFDRKTSLRGALSGVRRVAWTQGTPLDTIKERAHAHGATVNDVLLGALAGALRRHLEASGDALDDVVRAIVPVNLRPARSIEEMAPALGNRFGLVFLELPVDASTPAARLSRVVAEMERLKKSREPAVAFGILNALGASPPGVEHAVAKIFRRKASLVATNVPGPKRPLSFAGAPLRSILFWVPHPAKLALGISILSYAGVVRVGVRSDVAVLADPARIAQAFDDELRSLEASG